MSIGTRSKVYIGSHDPENPAFALQSTMKCTAHATGRGRSPAVVTIEQTAPGVKGIEITDNQGYYSGNDIFDYIDEDFNPTVIGEDAALRVCKVSMVVAGTGGNEETTIFLGLINSWRMVGGQGVAPKLIMKAVDYRKAVNKMPNHGVVIGRDGPTAEQSYWLKSGLAAFNVKGRPNRWTPIDETPVFCVPETDIPGEEDESEPTSAEHWTLWHMFLYVRDVYDSEIEFNGRKPAEDLGSWRTWFEEINVSDLAKERLSEDDIAPAELDITGRSFGECLDLIFARANNVGWGVIYSDDKPSIEVYAIDNLPESGITTETERQYKIVPGVEGDVQSYDLGKEAGDRYSRAIVLGKPDRYQATFSTLNQYDSDYRAVIDWDSADQTTFVAGAESDIKTARFPHVFLRYKVPEDFDWSELFDDVDGKPEPAYFKKSRPFLSTLLDIQANLYGTADQPVPLPIFIQRAILDQTWFRESDILPPEIGAKHIEILDQVVGEGGLILSRNARGIAETYWNDSISHDESDSDFAQAHAGPWTWNGDRDDPTRYEMRFTVAVEADSRLYVVKSIGDGEEGEDGEAGEDRELKPYEINGILIIAPYQNDYGKNDTRIEKVDGRRQIVNVADRDRRDIKNDNERASQRAAAELGRLQKDRRSGSITSTALDPTVQPGVLVSITLGVREYAFGPIETVSHDFETQTTTVTANA